MGFSSLTDVTGGYQKFRNVFFLSRSLEKRVCAANPMKGLLEWEYSAARILNLSRSSFKRKNYNRNTNRGWLYANQRTALDNLALGIVRFRNGRGLRRVCRFDGVCPGSERR